MRPAGGRRGAPGIVASVFGLGAVAAAFFLPGAAVALGVIAIIAAALEFLEVHRPGLTWAIVGGIGGLAGIGISAGIAASKSLNLGGFATNFLNVSTISDLGSQFARGALHTLEYALIAEVAGIVLGLFVAVFAISKSKGLRIPARVFVDVFRGTPLLMQLIVIYLGLPFLGISLSPFTAGALGLSLNSAAYVAEIFRAGIQSIERGQMEAARSLGLPYRSAMRYVIVPQAVRRVIPPLMNEFIALLKDSSLTVILGTTVETREILQVARDAYSNHANATPFVAASLIYLAMTVPLTRVVNRLEQKVRSA